MQFLFLQLIKHWLLPQLSNLYSDNMKLDLQSLTCWFDQEMVLGFSLSRDPMYTLYRDFKKMRDILKKLCALLRIKFFMQQDDTKIVYFDEGV